MKYRNDIRETMESSIHFINENYNQPLHLNDIAQKNYMSPSTYSRYFYEFTQCKFTDYLQNIRIEHAKKDLLQTQLSLTEIALNNGFSNSSIFSKTFHHMVHMTPSQYRKKFAPAKRVQLLPPNNTRVTLDVDSTNIMTISKSWLTAMNGGDAYLFLRADYQTHLLFLKEALSFRYVRIWDLLSSNIFPMPTNQLVGIDFNRLDQITDFLVNNRLIPWINLTKSSDGQLDDISKVTSQPLLESTYFNLEFTRFYEKLFNHWVHRYGIALVSQWIFEYWYDDTLLNDETKQKNIQLFSQIKTLLNCIIPGAKLGAWGEALPGTYSTMDTILETWPKDLTPDFLSVFSFPYMEDPNHQPVKIQSTCHIKDTLAMADELLHKHNITIPEIYITHWNMTVSPRNSLNDSCALASILLNNMEALLTYPYPCIFHYASDIVSAQNNYLPTIFGGIGLLTQHGFAKPVFWAHTFLSKLSDYCLCHGKGHIITTDNNGRYELLLFNPCELPQSYYELKEFEITNDYVLSELNRGDTLTFSINLHLKEMRYLQKTQRLIPGQTDLLGHLNEFGSYQNLSPEDIHYIDSVNRPKMTTREVTPTQDILKLDLMLQPGEICLITLQPTESLLL